jgi:hypothetical protein
MTADKAIDSGFPPGFFIIRSVANLRLLDASQDWVEDGTEIILYQEKEHSLVESALVSLLYDCVGLSSL